MTIQLSTEQDIEQILGALTGGRLLDVATGTGWFIAWMVESMPDCTQAVGIDLRAMDHIDDDSIFNRENVDFVQMDAYNMDFEDASFDTVTLSASIHHLDDPPRVLGEMLRVLKPGGNLIIAEMYHDHQANAQMTHVLMHHWWANVDSALGITHNETQTRQELADLIGGLGLRDLAFYDIVFNADADPKDEERRMHLLNRLEHYLDRAKDLPNVAEFETRAAMLRRRLDEIGFQSATVLIAIGQK